MLVLSRKKDECVLIDGGITIGGITVMIIEIRGDKVRLGFDAPKEITIHREEVQDAIDKEKEVLRMQGMRLET